ncbi:hypothetical protein HOU24_gp53 [Corynebacterium phage SamW]|uniref:Uncharacterized protein n=3 Tax=Samwavirus samW TaxID=2734273 RepID=A0A385UHM1_9CAUD|nr:hypothetical protein HOU24_gp53 [Corynebacterium phage SamW]YP_009849033.1 hypothetical protein HWC46_gp54 [Corynebacterium phage Lederberg]AYB70535.1 hypothetical protein SAMW_53 [Corynebacterium phage SamW]AYQ98830.1 hypothetical protein TROY_53 [Corynebacterium phage Troy]QDF20101.1 hypothetical protein SEA_LEDERBERG_54 [Corynebacterium phage Lederberg]
MSYHDYPHTGYGVEAHTDDHGWVLLEGIHGKSADATHAMADLTDDAAEYGFHPDDLRVVALTISRKGDAE